MSYRRQLEPKIGGPKRTRALIEIGQFVVFLPVVIFVRLLGYGKLEHHVLDSPISLTSLALPTLFSAILVKPFDYYVSMVSSRHFGPSMSDRICYKATILFAFLWAYYWNHPFTAQVSGIYGRAEVARQEHPFHLVTLMAAVGYYIAAGSNGDGKSSKGSLIGYSSTGQPLYSIHDQSSALNNSAAILKSFLAQILSDDDSRSIFYYLCINLTFAFVELICGIWNNSLGLVSDSFHMFFDCSALVMGLTASVIAKWKPTKKFSYGFGRVEVLSGFVNCLFLIVIGVMLVKEAIFRLVSPVEVHTHHLLSVAVVGLGVNIFGLVSFSHAHSHGGESCGGHGHSPTSNIAEEDSDHSHAHSHSDPHSHAHSHAHSHSKQIKKQNENMHGIYLHIMADLLGSVGVIISSLLVEHWLWYRADPFCTLFIALMIIYSVFPLLKSSAETLLLRTPSAQERSFREALHKIMQIKDVISYRDQKLWKFSSKVSCASIVVQLTPEGNEQSVSNLVTQYFKEANITDITVQCEKEAFVEYLEGLDPERNQSQFEWNTDIYHPERLHDDNTYI